MPTKSDHTTRPVRLTRLDVAPSANTLTRERDTCGACGASPEVGADTADAARSVAASDERPTPIAFSIDATASMLSVGRDSLYELIRTGRLATFKIGSRRLVAMRDIEAFIESAKEDA